jgi:hypothetical protein
LGDVVLRVHDAHTLAPGVGEGEDEMIALDLLDRVVYLAPIGAAACRSRRSSGVAWGVIPPAPESRASR